MFTHFARMAFKALRRFKLHSVISLLSLTFGFLCFISAVLLSNYVDIFDQHFPNSERIYNLVIRSDGRTVPDQFPIVHSPAAGYLRSAFPEIPNIVKASSAFPHDVTIAGRAQSLAVRYIEPRLFDIFPMETLYGLAPGEDLPPNSVMITEAAALKAFNRTDVVGERLLIANRHDVVIAGIAKKTEYPSHLVSSIAMFNTELFVPDQLLENTQRDQIAAAGGDPDADRWGNQSDYVYLEIPDALPFDVDEFNSRLFQFSKTTVPEEQSTGMFYELLPVNRLMTAQFALLTGGFDLTDILVVASALVLMIGCLNYSNLVIAQLSLRSQEIGVQKILGAKRGLLLLQYSFESLLFVGLTLCLTMFIVFLALARLGSAGVTGVSPMMLLNPSLWLYILAVSVLIVIIAGSYPALPTATVPVVTMLRPKGPSGYSERLRALMVGLQFFVSGTLMILALVMYAQNGAMTSQLDGTTADPKIAIFTPVDTYTVDRELLITELKQHPSILSVTQVDVLPWEISSSGTGMRRTRETVEEAIQISYHDVGYTYLETLGIPLLGGRDFSRDRANDLLPPFNQVAPGSGPYSILIDDQMAQSLGWANAIEALGQSVFRHIEPPTVPEAMVVEFTIIGAVGELPYQFIDFSMFGSRGNMYFLRPHSAGNLLVRVARENLNDGMVHIDETWTRLMPTISLKRRFIDELFFDTYTIFLTISTSISTLSIVGFLIARIGLLGNATFITNIRQKKVGIRKVMGASSKKLLAMLLIDFAKPIMIANAIAWPLGYVIGTGYTSLFAARAEVTIVPFLVSFLLSVLIAFAAVLSQSWKSARVRPAQVLRYE